MPSKSVPTEVILNETRASLGQLELDWSPQPSAHLELDGQIYMVLERKHRYHFRAGRYQLHQIILYVQRSHTLTDGQFLEGRWVLGDITCQYNARSELVRCAVNPNGPCQGCPDYRPLDPHPAQDR